jgi:hypothetical protein
VQKQAKTVCVGSYANGAFYTDATGATIIKALDIMTGTFCTSLGRPNPYKIATRFNKGAKLPDISHVDA